MKYTVLLITLYGFNVMMVPAVNVQEFFPQIKANLTKVTWAHAVNNSTYLETTLADDQIMMIEADIVLGTTSESADKIIPIMAHPPIARSDLSLDEFLKNVSSHNNEVANNGTKKGVKLDFKTIEALSEAVEIFRPYTKEGKFPIWINADILPGPINSTVKPVDATEFFEKTKSIEHILYSIGWTTEYGAEMEGDYTENQIEEMIDTIHNNSIKNEITFPVRAGLAAESLEQMKKLLTVKGSTLTIWSSEGDNVNTTHLNTLINDIGVEKIYIDVPSDLMDKIEILPPQPSGAVSLTSAATIGLLLIFTILIKFL